MSSIKLSAIIFVVSSFLAACNQQEPEQQRVSTIDTYQTDPSLTQVQQNEYWARDNFDLPRAGVLLEKANSPEEFERYLNAGDGINNLDLNGDGYADYISVDEFGERDDRQRGLSLYTRFGPDLIQEIASIFFYRDRYDAPGARILLRGNENIYGDNYYYETNWLDRSLGLVSTLFSPRDEYYRSPYYYDNYPPYYEVYDVVETPIYRSRIEQLYPQPVFVYSANPTITQITIDSPYEGRYVPTVYAQLAKPTKEQAEFIKNNPMRPAINRAEKEARKAEKEVQKAEKRADKEMDKLADKAEKEERKLEKEAAKPMMPDSPAAKPGKQDNPGRAKGQDEGKVGGKGKKP